MSLDDQLNLDDTGFNLELANYFVERVRPYLRDPVLDLGCGVGVISKKLADLRFKVTGVDGNKKKIGYAGKKMSYITWIHSYFEDYEPENKFKTVILKNVLEHLAPGAVKSLLEDVYNWLEVAGKLIIYVPNALSLNRRLGYFMGISPHYGALTKEDKEVGHVQTYTRQKLVMQVNFAGFKTLECQGLFLKPFPNVMMMLISEKICKGLFEVARDPMVADLCSGIYLVTEKPSHRI